LNPVSLRLRSRPTRLGFIEPCLPTAATKPPSGPGWLHEIKHDGFRTMVLRAAERVRVWAVGAAFVGRVLRGGREGPLERPDQLADKLNVLTRNGIDWTERFSLIATAAAALNVRSCLIDGEAIASGDDGVADFEMLRRGAPAILCAFDLLELDGMDLRREPIEVRKALLARLLRSMSTSTMRTLPAFSSTPAGWASRASSPSARAPRISRGGPTTG
jgi:bifunctional non-homologous end joining protein LigD